MNKQPQDNDEKESQLSIDDHCDDDDDDREIWSYKYRMVMRCSLGVYFTILLMATIIALVISNTDLCSMLTFLLFTSIIAAICYADSHCCSNSWLNTSFNHAQNLVRTDRQCCDIA
ncbi:hypothetical protein DERF_010946 [Dermatophagoides farinae]|uniref:Uncharacterized protein n=1 Tax=Dermatophagoides farinae TaxID=6954 RepID=A0A922HTZ7_DERFA|nr:hypothetical protein HUG17_9481 [Dermatophagoides farinae]KAH9506204.1 hypothetical protein DERF_010946 [Dermatophagoides farinae]